MEFFKNIDYSQFKIVKHDNGDYYILFKRKFLCFSFWTYMNGADRGAPGVYNYQIESSANPFFHIQYTIPEFLAEKYYRTIPCFKKPLRLPKIKGKVLGVLDISKLRVALDKYRNSSEYSVKRP